MNFPPTPAFGSASPEKPGPGAKQPGDNAPPVPEKAVDADDVVELNEIDDTEEPTQLRALVMEDDARSIRLLVAQLYELVPSLSIVSRILPDLTGDFDIYFLDADFGGLQATLDRAAKLRTRHPGALILVLTDKIDADLRQPPRGSYDLICKKNDPIDMDFAFHAVARFAHEHGAPTRRRR